MFQKCSQLDFLLGLVIVVRERKESRITTSLLAPECWKGEDAIN